MIEICVGGGIIAVFIVWTLFRKKANMDNLTMEILAKEHREKNSDHSSR